MMSFCIVCKAHSDGIIEKRSFHKFPSDQLLKQKWLESLNLTSVKKWHAVCNHHFSPDSFRKSFGLDLRARLNANAVPNLQNHNYVQEPIHNENISSTRCEPTSGCEVLKDNSFPENIAYSECSVTKKTFEVHSETTTKSTSCVTDASHHKRCHLAQNCNEYLDPDDFASTESWEHFVKHMKLMKLEKNASYMREYWARNVNKKMQCVVNELKDKKQTELAPYLEAQKRAREEDTVSPYSEDPPRNLYHHMNEDFLPSVQAIKKEVETGEEISTPEVSVASTSRCENPCAESATDDMSSNGEFSDDSFDMDQNKMKRPAPTPEENSKKMKPLIDEELLLQKSFDILQGATKEVDESSHFGDLVACKLRALDEYTRCAVQTDIMNLFLRANAGYYNRTDESTRRTNSPSLDDTKQFGASRERKDIQGGKTINGGNFGGSDDSDMSLVSEKIVKLLEKCQEVDHLRKLLSEKDEELVKLSNLNTIFQEKFFGAVPSTSTPSKPSLISSRGISAESYPHCVSRSSSVSCSSSSSISSLSCSHLPSSLAPNSSSSSKTPNCIQLKSSKRKSRPLSPTNDGPNRVAGFLLNKSENAEDGTSSIEVRLSHESCNPTSPKRHQHSYGNEEVMNQDDLLDDALSSLEFRSPLKQESTLGSCFEVTSSCFKFDSSSSNTNTIVNNDISISSTHDDADVSDQRPNSVIEEDQESLEFVEFHKGLKVEAVKLKVVESRPLSKTEDSTFVKELAVLVFGLKTLYNSSLKERKYSKEDGNGNKKPRKMLDKDLVEAIRQRLENRVMKEFNEKVPTNQYIRFHRSTVNRHIYSKIKQIRANPKLADLEEKAPVDD